MPTNPDSNHDEFPIDLNSVSQLIQKSRNGDAAARELLLTQMQDYLELMANKYMDRSLQNKAGPSDIVQQSMALVFENIEQFRGESEAEFRGWLKTIVVNEMNKMRRSFHAEKRNVRREQPIQSDDSVIRQRNSPVDRNLTPSSEAIAAEKIQQFHRILQQLPDDYSEVIRLRSIEQMPFSRIADEMDRTHNSVTKLWYRAVLKLEELLRESEDDFVSKSE